MKTLEHEVECEISIEDVNTRVLAQLEPEERHYNMNFLEGLCNNLSDSAINAWQKGNEEEAKRWSDEFNRMKRTIAFYQKHRVFAIERAKDYESVRTR